MFDDDVFCLAIEEGDLEEYPAERKINEVMRRVAKACDAIMPRRGNRNPHTPAYWWNDVVAEARRESNHAKRLVQRARGKPSYLELEEKYREACAKLTKVIKQSKRRTWTELLDQIKKDPWDRSY